MKTTKPKLERGAAGCIVELSRGHITVRHQDSKQVLIKRAVPLGFWSGVLWPVLSGKPNKK